MKRVHMSTLAPAPIMYRRDHNLLDFDEEMSVLVQKVVGRRADGLFMPFAAGVAFSYNPYHWTARIRKEDGLVRLVLGLGTRAVERVSQDYPRMIPLSHPQLRPEVTAEQIRKYSQWLVDVLNLETASLESLPYLELLSRCRKRTYSWQFRSCAKGTWPLPLKGYPVEPANPSTFDNFLTKTLCGSDENRIEIGWKWPTGGRWTWNSLGTRATYLLQCRTLPMRGTECGPVHYQRRNIRTPMTGAASSIVRDIELWST
jgi:hypothetical protein